MIGPNLYRLWLAHWTPFLLSEIPLELVPIKKSTLNTAIVGIYITKCSHRQLFREVRLYPLSLLASMPLRLAIVGPNFHCLLKALVHWTLSLLSETILQLVPKRKFYIKYCLSLESIKSNAHIDNFSGEFVYIYCLLWHPCFFNRQ